jgi:hypothetical protein
VRAALRLATILATLTAGGAATGPLAAQDQQPAPASRTDAIQIEMPVAESDGRAGRAYLDTANRLAPPAPPRNSLTQIPGDQISRGSGTAPASQISARGQGGSAVAQLSKADLDATLAQLSAAERRVLLQAIEGTDICDNPPAVAAIVALCQSRIETRSAEFSGVAERPASAEDRLLRGDLESTALPTIGQVIDRLARSGASSGDLSNQAIASIALGTNAPAAPTTPGEEEQLETGNIGEEAQALINALINQLGGRAP